jgi:hypothetical protein
LLPRDVKRVLPLESRTQLCGAEVNWYSAGRSLWQRNSQTVSPSRLTSRVRLFFSSVIRVKHPPPWQTPLPDPVSRIIQPVRSPQKTPQPSEITSVQPLEQVRLSLTPALQPGGTSFPATPAVFNGFSMAETTTRSRFPQGVSQLSDNKLQPPFDKNRLGRAVRCLLHLCAVSWILLRTGMDE